MGVPPVWQVPPSTGGGDDVASVMAFGILVAAMIASYVVARSASRRGRTPDIDQVRAEGSESREPALVP